MPGWRASSPNWVAGETALHVAAAQGRQTVAELLIERGAPLEAKRHGGCTPLRVAFRCLEQQSEWTPNEYTLPIAETLIKAGASVEDAGLTLTAAVCLGRSDDIARLAEDSRRRRETEGPGSRGLQRQAGRDRRCHRARRRSQCAERGAQSQRHCAAQCRLLRLARRCAETRRGRSQHPC